MMLDRMTLTAALCGLAAIMLCPPEVAAQTTAPGKPAVGARKEVLPTRSPATAPAVAAAPPALAAAMPAPVATAPAHGTEPGGDEVVARLGTTDLSASDIRAYLGQLGPREQAAIARDPALLSQSVRLLLANQLALKEALAKKWDQDPAVAAQLEQVRRQAIVELYLQTVSAPPAGFPSEAEIESAYEANKTALLVPRQYHVAQIFIALAADADKDAEDKARHKVDEVSRKLKLPGADFAAVAAAESSERETAERGGDIGWLAEAQMRAEIRGQVAGLAKGAVTEPVRLDDGWHVLKLVDTKAAVTRPLAEVHDLLAQRLREERATANRRSYLARLLEQTPPAINEIALTRLLDHSARQSAK